jgi:predicted transglutaminase-like cysteine proteinase
VNQTLTTDLWESLCRIQQAVNKDIRYVVDSKLYEQEDYWTVVEGKGRGDCDDYALTKIKRLVAETKWDRENLAVAICFTEDEKGRPGKGVGHAVCVARTNRGDFVLDNRYKDVKAYDELPYRWVKMEDFTNKCWVIINS